MILALAALAAASDAGAATVRMDENTLIELRAPAGNVIVGNPSIADVTLITPTKIAILGRSYGLTNLIITDRMGRVIFQQEISVSDTSRGRLSLYRGPLVANYSCAPRCQRTPMAGEEKSSSYEPYSGAYKDYGERAKGDSGGSGGTGAP